MKMNDSGYPGPVTEDLLGSVAEQAVSDRRRKAGTDVPPKKRMDGTDVPPKKNGWNGCPPKGGNGLADDGTDDARKLEWTC